MPQTTKCGLGLIWLVKQLGKDYRLGAEAALGADSSAWDCSELVQHFLWHAGVRQIAVGDSVTDVAAFDKASNQYAHSRHVPVWAATHAAGALLFACPNENPANIAHVAVSLGNGHTIEARGRAYGVVCTSVRTSSGNPRFRFASKIDELYVEDDP